MARFSRRTTTLVLFDGGGHSWTLLHTPMDITISNLAENNAEALEARDRHAHDGLFYGDDLTQEFSITAELPNTAITSAAVDTINNWLNKTGKCLAYTSTDSTVWAIGARLVMADGGVTSTVTLGKVRGTGAAAVAKEGNTLAFSGVNYTAPVIA